MTVPESPHPPGHVTPAHGSTVVVTGATVVVTGAAVVVAVVVGAAGVAGLDAPDVLDPYAFDAVTVNVYAVPFVRPETVIGEAPVPVRPPGLDVAV